MLQLESNFAAIADVFAAGAAEADTAQLMILGRTALEARDILAGSIKDHTPIGEREDGDETEHLADTTKGEAGEVSLAGTEVTIRQTKTVSIKGHPYPLWALVTDGHDAPPNP